MSRGKISSAQLDDERLLATTKYRKAQSIPSYTGSRDRIIFRRLNVMETSKKTEIIHYTEIA